MKRALIAEQAEGKPAEDLVNDVPAVMRPEHHGDSSITSTDHHHVSNSDAASSRDRSAMRRNPKPGLGHGLKRTAKLSDDAIIPKTSKNGSKTKGNKSTSADRVGPCPVCGGTGRTRPNSRKCVIC